MNRTLCGTVSLHNMEVIREILTAGCIWEITPPSIKFRALEYKISRTNSVICLNFTGNKLYMGFCQRRLDLSITLEYPQPLTVVPTLLPKPKIILPRKMVCFIQTPSATCITSLFTQRINPLNPELNPICYLLALLGGHHFLHVNKIRLKLLTLRRLMSYIYMEHPF